MLKYKELIGDKRYFIRRMFEAIDKLDELKDFDFDKVNWYWTYTWTTKQENLFTEAYSKYLKCKHDNLHHDIINNIVMYDIMNYGWKINEDNISG